MLTHWGRVTHICVSKLTIIISVNSLSPGQRQAIIWTNAGILLIRTLGTNFSEILSEIHAFSFKKLHLKILSAKWRTFCLGLNVLIKGAPGWRLKYQKRVDQGLRNNMLSIAYEVPTDHNLNTKRRVRITVIITPPNTHSDHQVQWQPRCLQGSHEEDYTHLKHNNKWCEFFHGDWQSIDNWQR